MRLATTLFAAILASAASPALHAADCPSPATLQNSYSSFPALGLRLRLPVGARVESSSIGQAHQSFAVRPADSTWRIDVSESQVRDSELTPLQAASNLAASLLRTTRKVDGRTGQMVGSEVEIVSQPAEIDLAGAPASRFYVSLPVATPRGQTQVFEGYTFVQTAPGRLLVFKMQCLPAEQPCAQDAFESILATLEVRDAGEAAAERAAAVRAGEGFLKSRTLDDYRAALEDGARWYRLHRPAGPGSPEAQEVAYQAVEARIGRRSDIARQPGEPAGSADQEGLVVKIIARYVEGRRTVDSESTFFQAITDGRLEGDETWSIRMVVREGADNAVWMETGVRDARRLTVRTVAPGSPPTQKSWIPPEEGYLSQAQSLILPRLLALEGSPFVLSFYTYNSALGELTLRRDVLEPDSEGGDGGAGGEGWILSTTLAEGADQRRTTLSRDGRIVRSQLNSGVVMEPTDPDRIRSLWRSKGLPTN